MSQMVKRFTQIVEKKKAVTFDNGYQVKSKIRNR